MATGEVRNNKKNASVKVNPIDSDKENIEIKGSVEDQKLDSNINVDDLGANVKEVKLNSDIESKNLKAIIKYMIEVDPLFRASPAYGITETNKNNWDEAFGWGNHADAGYLTDISGQDLSTADNSVSQFITNADIDWATNVPLNETDPLSLHLDQTTPQYVTGGKPDFASGITLKTDTYRYGVGNVTFYVDYTAGDDSNDGLSTGAPFKNITKAVAEAIKYQTYASISIRLMPGTHDLATPINIIGLQTKFNILPSNYVSSATINYTGAGAGATVMKFTDCPYDVTVSSITIVGKYTAIASDNSNLFLGDLILNSFTHSGIYAYNKSNVYINSNITATSTSTSSRSIGIEIDDSTVNYVNGDLVMNTNIGYKILNKSNVALSCTQTYTSDSTYGTYGAYIENSSVKMDNTMTFDGNSVADYGLYLGAGSVVTMPTYARTRAFTGFQTTDVYLASSSRLNNSVAGTWTYSGGAVKTVYASQGASIFSPDEMDTTIEWEALTASDFVGYDDRYVKKTDGWDGSFTNGDGDTVTVLNGQITDVS